MTILRLVALVALAIGVTVSVAGCGRYAPPFVPPLFGTHRTDYVGVWVHTEHDSSHGSTLTLNSDGTASLTDMPDLVLSPSADGSSVAKAKQLFSTTGSWSTLTDTYFGSPEIALTMDTVPNSPGGLSAELIYDAGPGDRSLNFIIGDPDSGEFYDFSR